VTWYFIQSPFFTPTGEPAKATAINETAMISTIRVIASHLDLCMLGQTVLCFCTFKGYQISARKRVFRF
jgi:hypothetical protein